MPHTCFNCHHLLCNHKLCINSFTESHCPVFQMKEEVDALRAHLRSSQVSLDKAGSQLVLQRLRTQQLVDSWKVKLGEAEERMRKQRRQRDKELGEITSQLLFFEGQLKKEQSEIKSMIAEKNKIIDTQRKKILELTAANNKLAEAMAKIKQQLQLQMLSGSGMLSPRPTYRMEEEFNVDWDINNEVFDVERSSQKSPSPRKHLPLLQSRPATYGSEENLCDKDSDYGASNLQRSRSLPLLDDEDEAGGFRDPVPQQKRVLTAMPDVLPQREISRSMDILNDTPRSHYVTLRSPGSQDKLDAIGHQARAPRSAYHPQGSISPMSPISNIRTISPRISAPNDLSGAERKDKSKRGILRLRDVKKRNKDKVRSLSPKDVDMPLASPPHAVTKRFFSFAF